MEKKLLHFKPQKLLKNERWRPYVRYEKETDTWIAKAIKEKRSGSREMEKTMDKIPSKIKVLMEREELDIIARIIAYMYHGQKDEYKHSSSDMQKEHIYKDLRSIDQWLNIQYQRLEQQEEKDIKINKLDQEIINEQSK